MLVCPSVDADGFEQDRKCGCVQHETTAVLQHVRDFVEGLHQAQLYGRVLFGLAKNATTLDGVFIKYTGRKEDADGKDSLAVGADVEDELGGGRERVVGQGVALADEIVLVHKACLRRIGFDPTNGHGRDCTPAGLREYVTKRLTKRVLTVPSVVREGALPQILDLPAMHRLL